MNTGDRILVVDDEKNLCLLYQQVLQAEGYVVRTATSAMEALETMKEFKPELVVMDIRMPGMDGIEAMGRMLNAKNDLPIILNSAYSSYKDNFCTWAASAYLVKSSDMEELIETVGKLLRRARQEQSSSQAA